MGTALLKAFFLALTLVALCSFLHRVQIVVVFSANGYSLLLIDNTLLLFIVTIGYFYFQKPVLCVLLESFLYEINRCLGILNGLALSHSNTPGLLKF